MNAAEARQPIVVNADISAEKPWIPPTRIPQNMERSEGLKAEGIAIQSHEDITQSVDDVHLALAWADVSCSFADIKPRLTETNEWFWFLVSSIYFDLGQSLLGQTALSPFSRILGI